MIENTSSSTNQSPNAEVEPSNENLPTQRVGGISLLDIPTFNRSSSPRKEPLSPTQEITPPSAPLSYDDGKVVYEYEFTCIYTDSTPMFIGLWDTDDLSACQRVSASNIDREEISYNKETGMGFFNTTDGLRWCFKKEVYQRSIGPCNPIGVHPSELTEIKTKSRKVVQQSAEDILAEI